MKFTQIRILEHTDTTISQFSSSYNVLYDLVQLVQSKIVNPVYSPNAHIGKSSE